MIILTYNNLSCAYKRVGKIKQAKNCLEKALEIQKINGDDQSLLDTQSTDGNLSLTELNLCVIHSQLNDHIKSKEFALQAVDKVEQELEQMRLALQKMDAQQRQSHSQAYNEKLQFLAIANYNLGSQHEYLKEYQNAIQRYELSISLIQNLNQPSPLEQEFRNSLKQVKSKYQAQKMKGPDRTFTNLNKDRLDDQILIQAQKQNVPYSNISNARSLSQGKARKIRPASAQIQIKQQSNSKSNKNETNNEQQQSIQKEQPSQQHFTRPPIRQRPTSSYVQREQKLLPKNNFLTSSFTNIQQSQFPKDQLTSAYEESVDKGFLRQNIQTNSEKRLLPTSSMNGSQSNFRQSVNNQKKTNIQEDDMLEIIEDDGGASCDNQFQDDSHEIHPLMLNRRNNNNYLTKVRPISAKTQLSKFQQSNLGQVNNQKSSYQKSFTSSIMGQQNFHSRHKSIEKIYNEAEKDIFSLKNQKLNGLKQIDNKPPKFKPPRGNSKLRNQNFQLTQQQENRSQFSQTRSISKPKSNINNKNLISNNNLFDIIDASFNELEISNIQANQEIMRKSNGLNKHKGNNLLLRDLYSRENMIQQEIFYYNNAILPTVVEEIQNNNFKTQIQKINNSTYQNTSKSSNNQLKNGFSIRGLKNRPQDQDVYGEVLQNQIDRNSSKIKLGNGKAKKKLTIKNSFNLTDLNSKKNLDSTGDDIKPIMIQILKQEQDMSKSFVSQSYIDKQKAKASRNKTNVTKSQYSEVDQKKYFSMNTNTEKGLKLYV